MVHAGSIVVLLVTVAIALMMGIEFTYSSTFEKHEPAKKKRMYVRALAYVLLTCTGVLLVTVVYGIASQDIRASCKVMGGDGQGISAVPQVSVSIDGQPFRALQATS